MNPIAQLIAGGTALSAPGVHDGTSALLADRLPFNSVYMSGYCVAASRFGLPDAGLVGLSDMLQVVTLIKRCTAHPLIADADAGYGGLLNVQHTVREYERAGVAAIQLEDQEAPKKCGHTKGKRVVDRRDGVARVEVAVESRRDMLVIARTDALATHGIDEAIERCRLYRAAGAAVVFVDAMDSEETIRRIAGELAPGGPLMINVTPPVAGFVTPELSRDELAQLGFAIAIYPGLFMSPSLQGMEVAGRAFLDEGRQSGGEPGARINAHELVGFPTVWIDEERWQRRYGQPHKIAAA